MSEVNQLNIVYWKVLNTALYHTKVLLGFSSKHTQVDIPEIINEIKCLLSELNNGEDAVSYLTQNDVKWLNENIKALEQEPILDKVRADITKFADTIPFNIGEVKAKYTNIGQHDGLEQALEIIDGNIKGDFDIDKWMAESEE